jgi:hypothetical protein
MAAKRARHLRQNGHKDQNTTAPVGPLLENFAIGEDFRGPRHLARRLGDRFRAGIVLYAGEQQLSFGDRLTALPMAALWMLDSSAS